MLSRWFRVVGGILMNLSLGSVYAWSLFIAPLEGEFGWKRADTSFVFTIAIVAAATGFIAGGRIQDKKGALIVSLLGSVLFSVGFIMCRFADSLLEFYVAFGGVVGLGSGLGYVTPIGVGSKWFPDKRGLVVGLMVAGYAAGSAILGLPFVGPKMIATLGWRDTFLYLGMVYFVATVAAAFLLRDPPPGYRPPGWNPPTTEKGVPMACEFSPSEMIQTKQFLRMWFAYVLGASAGLMVISQLVPFARAVLATNKTESSAVAALAASTLIVGAVGNVGGRILSGWMSDFVGRIQTLAAMMVLSALGMAVLCRSQSLGLLYAGILAVFYGYGTLLSLFASTTIDFFGTRNLGANCGVMFTAWGVAGILGPRIAGKLFDAYGEYTIAFTIGSLLSVVASALIARVKAPAKTGPSGG